MAKYVKTEEGYVNRIGVEGDASYSEVFNDYNNNVASGDLSHAEGYHTTASGYYSHAEGCGTTASSQSSHAEGSNTTASGGYSHAEGYFTTASGNYSHAEGYRTVSSGYHSHAEGGNRSSSGASYVDRTITFPDNSTVNIEGSTAVGIASHAEGVQTYAYGYSSHTEGQFTDSFGIASHAEGYYTTASGDYGSHAEGTQGVASGRCSHVEGGFYTPSEGMDPVYNTASEYSAHAEGSSTTASGNTSHAEGGYTVASGDRSHAEGFHTIASSESSHAEGVYTTALYNQHAQGHYNNTTTASATSSYSGTSTGTAFVIGNGTSAAGSNAFRVTYNGETYAKAAYNSTGADYAEFFEWLDGNPETEDRRGCFVTLDGDKIKIANHDDYILGIISGQPSVIGNADEDWMGRYILDEFGSFITEEFEYEEKTHETVIEEETNEPKVVEKVVLKTGTKYKENPDYDNTRAYTQRQDRPEWDAVGMLGVLHVRDDGTCKVNGYCAVSDGGIATAAETGYRVIKRVNENVVKIIFR